jgi:hypothetical protein
VVKTTEDGTSVSRGKMSCRWKGWRLCRAEALDYMPILRTNHVVQGFIPANSWTQARSEGEKIREVVSGQYSSRLSVADSLSTDYGPQTTDNKFN